MKQRNVIVIERQTSPIKIIFKIATVLVTVAAACAVAYKYLENKYRSQILGKIDLDGDGEADAIMIDTTGNGEVDTIIIDTDFEDDVEE